jgi:hypothetical protein
MHQWVKCTLIGGRADTKYINLDHVVSMSRVSSDTQTKISISTGGDIMVRESPVEIFRSMGGVLNET